MCLEQKAAEIDGMSKEEIKSYIEACQCPYCRDGKSYKMLANHICWMHGLSAYELRKELGLNRGHKICSPELSEKFSVIHKKIVRDNKPFLDFNRTKSTLNRYEDGGQRQEACRAKSLIALTPERKALFEDVMSKVDRKAISAKIPPEIRRSRAKHAGDVFKAKAGPSKLREMMLYAQSFITPQGRINQGRYAAKILAKKYRSDPKWLEEWKRKVANGIRNGAGTKVTNKDKQVIAYYHLIGLSNPEIASMFDISHSRVQQILHEVLPNVIIIRNGGVGMPSSAKGKKRKLEM